MADPCDAYTSQKKSLLATFQARKTQDDVQVSGGNSKKQRMSTTQQNHPLPTDLRAISGMENHISKKLRGYDTLTVK